MTETYGGWETPGSGPTRQSDELTRHDGMRRELDRLYDEVARLESEIHGVGDEFSMTSRGVLVAHLLAGLILGFLGATVSLLFHVVGSLLIGQHPLELVRVFLTILLGERALALETGSELAIGVVLFLCVGALYGVVFHTVLAGLFALAPAVWRLLAATALGVVLWVVNVYIVLGWLHPLVAGGPSLKSLLPAWLAALTHVVFAWSILAFESRGRVVPRRVSEGNDLWPTI